MVTDYRMLASLTVAGIMLGLIFALALVDGGYI